MLRAEKRGPRPDDPDWLLVETMMACAARMEAASPMTEKTLAARGRCNVIASGTPALYAVRL